MGSEKLKALCESIRKAGASPLVEHLIELLEERGLLTPIVTRSCTGPPPWPDILVYHRAHGWSVEETYRMGFNGDDSIHESESCGDGSGFNDSSLTASPQRSTAGENTAGHNNGLPPMKEGLAEKVGCWPGQFNDRDWRKW